MLCRDLNFNPFLTKTTQACFAFFVRTWVAFAFWTIFVLLFCVWMSFCSLQGFRELWGYSLRTKDCFSVGGAEPPTEFSYPPWELMAVHIARRIPFCALAGRMALRWLSVILSPRHFQPYIFSIENIILSKLTFSIDTSWHLYIVFMPSCSINIPEPYIWLSGKCLF